MATVRKSKKKFIIPICIVLIIAIVGGSVFFAKSKEGEEVTLATIGTADIVQTVALTGKVTAGTVQEYKVGTVATVKEVFVKVGDNVKEGDALASFDVSKLDQQVNSLNTSYNESKKSYNEAVENQKAAAKKSKQLATEIAKAEKEVNDLTAKQLKTVTESTSKATTKTTTKKSADKSTTKKTSNKSTTNKTTKSTTNNSTTKASTTRIDFNVTLPSLTLPSTTKSESTTKQTTTRQTATLPSLTLPSTTKNESTTKTSTTRDGLNITLPSLTLPSTTISESTTKASTNTTTTKSVNTTNNILTTNSNNNSSNDSLSSSVSNLSNSLSQITTDLSVLTKSVDVIVTTISTLSKDLSNEEIAKILVDELVKSGIAENMAKQLIDAIDIELLASQMMKSDTARLSTAEISLVSLTAQKAICDVQADTSIVDAEKKALDATKTALDVVKEQQQELSQGWKAAFDGTITAVNIVPGMDTTLISSGITLENLDSMSVTVSLSEYDLHKVKLGMPAVVKTAYGSYDGEVTFIAPTATGGSSSGILDNVGSMAGISGLSSLTQSGAGVECIISIPQTDENITAGFDAKAEITTGEYTGVTAVGIGSIVLEKEGSFVYLYNEEEGTVSKTRIETGASSSTYYEVTSGLKVGDKIVSAPSSTYEEETFKVKVK